MADVFISYVRENSADVGRLASDLRRFGIGVWLDREKIKPGALWPEAIEEAIRKGAGFIACFSQETQARERTHMYEELNIAITELRRRPLTQSWFIPVLLSPSEVPKLTIRPGLTLHRFQSVKLYEDWEGGVRRIADVIAPVSGIMWDILEPMEKHRVPSFRGRVKYTVEEVFQGSHVTLSSPRRQQPSILLWKDIERVYTWEGPEELTPTLVDEILKDSKNLDSSPMCALVLAMWDASRVESL